MPEPDDHCLLADFVRDRSEAAFTELVSRYAGLVYSTALRFCNNPHHAEEITQAVFIILTRKAGTLSPRVVVSGWLYQTARLTAANFVKGEIRRLRREQEAAMQSDLHESDSTAWDRIAPLLDEAMGALNETDRNAVLLRYFESRTSSEIGVALRMNEETARKRVNRALEKLRQFFVKRGVTISGTALSGALSTHSLPPISAALVKSLSAVSLANGAAASASTLTLVKGALKIMAWTKMKTVIVTAVVAIAAVGGATITAVVIKKSNADAVEKYFMHWDSMNIDTAPLPSVVVLRPSKYANAGDFIIVSGALEPDGRIMRRGTSFSEILETAYGFSRELMVLPPNLPRGQFDLLLTTPRHSRELLRAEIKKRFGIIAHPETRSTAVLVLKSINPRAPGIKISAGGGPNIWTGNASLTLRGYKMADIAHVIGRFFNQPIIDETGLPDSYDVDAKWNGNLQGKALQNEIENMLRNQFGLELTPDNRPVEMLIVEKVK